jgi:hypothetical protein
MGKIESRFSHAIYETSSDLTKLADESEGEVNQAYLNAIQILQTHLDSNQIYTRLGEK